MGPRGKNMSVILLDRTAPKFWGCTLFWDCTFYLHVQPQNYCPRFWGCTSVLSHLVEVCIRLIRAWVTRHIKVSKRKDQLFIHTIYPMTEWPIRICTFEGSVKVQDAQWCMQEDARRQRFLAHHLPNIQSSITFRSPSTIAFDHCNRLQCNIYSHNKGVRLLLDVQNAN